MTDDEIGELVERFWDALNQRDFAAVGAMMSERGHYVDVPVIGVEPGAHGPAQTEARLRLGLEACSATTGSHTPAPSSSPATW